MNALKKLKSNCTKAKNESVGDLVKHGKHYLSLTCMQMKCTMNLSQELKNAQILESLWLSSEELQDAY